VLTSKEGGILKEISIVAIDTVYGERGFKLGVDELVNQTKQSDGTKDVADKSILARVTSECSPWMEPARTNYDIPSGVRRKHKLSLRSHRMRMKSTLLGRKYSFLGGGGRQAGVNGQITCPALLSAVYSPTYTAQE
jgi:hypothetical protein